MFKRYVSLQNPGHLLQDRYQQVLCQLRFDSDYRQQYSFGSGGSTQRKREEKSGRASLSLFKIRFLKKLHIIKISLEELVCWKSLPKHV